MTFQVGDIVGDYEIVGVLGQGGMGHVYRVRNLLTFHHDAMKVIAPGQVNGDLADRFLREIRVHASLDHPHIAAFRTALRVENIVVMVIELVEGVNIEERLRAGPIDWPEAAAYANQALQALAFAHSRGVIHRDIKPANLILTPAGQIKITDFGIAHSAADPRLTATGMAVGSLYYMCPEQVKSQPVDARSDIYSLGATLYEMVTGERPIRGQSEYEILTGHLMQVPAAPRSLNPRVPDMLSGVILKALEKDPAARFQSAEDFRQAMRHLFEEGPIAGAAPSPSAAFDPDLLAKAEANLAPVIGPIARQLVERTARRSSNVTELCRALADQIPPGADRQAFLRQFEVEPPPQPRAGTGAQPIDAALTQRAKEKLAQFIGPIAGVLADRAARQSRTRDEFLQKLAAEIAGESDRQAFLAALR